MKKLLTLTMVFALALALTACGGTSGNTSAPAPADAASGSASTSAEASTSSAASSSSDSSTGADASTSSDAAANSETAGGSTDTGSTLTLNTSAADTVLYDKDGLKITYTGLTKDDYQYTLNLSYENTSDKDYDVQARDDTLDGTANLLICSDTVGAGQAAEGGIAISLADLEKAGISAPKQAECNLSIVHDITEDVGNVQMTINFDE